MVRRLVVDIQRKLVQERSDDVESFTEILAIYEVLLFCHGRDEEEVSDHVEEHKRGKADQRDQLVRGKHHLARYTCLLKRRSKYESSPNIIVKTLRKKIYHTSIGRVHLDRVTLQWEVATWLKNLLVMESLPPDMVTHLMT